jgi:F0F1-type ATP synthase delta subunit
MSLGQFVNPVLQRQERLAASKQQFGDPAAERQLSMSLADAISNAPERFARGEERGRKQELRQRTGEIFNTPGLSSSERLRQLSQAAGGAGELSAGAQLGQQAGAEADRERNRKINTITSLSKLFEATESDEQANSLLEALKQSDLSEEVQPMLQYLADNRSTLKLGKENKRDVRLITTDDGFYRFDLLSDEEPELIKERKTTGEKAQERLDVKLGGEGKKQVMKIADDLKIRTKWQKATAAIAAAPPIHELIQSDSPMAPKSVRTLLPRLFGEVGNLNQQEQDAFSGTELIYEQIDQFTQRKLIDGKLTEANKKYMTKLVDTLVTAARRTRNQEIFDFASSRAESSGMKFEKVVRPLIPFLDFNSEKEVKDSIDIFKLKDGDKVRLKGKLIRIKG